VSEYQEHLTRLVRSGDERSTLNYLNIKLRDTYIDLNGLRISYAFLQSWPSMADGASIRKENDVLRWEVE
jgi:hypothetical protein